jgi:hypothetical protein
MTLEELATKMDDHNTQDEEFYVEFPDHYDGDAKELILLILKKAEKHIASRAKKYDDLKDIALTLRENQNHHIYFKGTKSCDALLIFDKAMRGLESE